MKKKIRNNKDPENEKARQKTLEFITSWIDERLKNYSEPSRRNIPKGDPIGFPLNKKRAAYLMILYPRVLRLKEISNLAGVSHDVLRYWRTKADFREECKRAGQEFATQFINTLELSAFEMIRWQNIPSINSRIDKLKENIHFEFKEGHDSRTMFSFLCSSFQFYSQRVADQVSKWITTEMKNEKEYPNAYLGIFTRLMGKNVVRKFWRRAESLEITKDVINTVLDLVTDPENWQREGAERMMKYKETLKNYIEAQLDILAG